MRQIGEVELWMKTRQPQTSSSWKLQSWSSSQLELYRKGGSRQGKYDTMLLLKIPLWHNIEEANHNKSNGQP